MTNTKMTALQQEAAAIRTRIANINDGIRATERYIDNNRHDRESVREAQADIADYKHDLQILSERLKHIETQIRAGTIPAPITTAPGRLAGLYATRRVLNDRLMKLSDEMDACAINMDLAHRPADVVSQAEQDLMYYTNEYERTTDQLNALVTEIAKLER